MAMYRRPNGRAGSDDTTAFWQDVNTRHGKEGTYEELGGVFEQRRDAVLNSIAHWLVLERDRSLDIVWQVAL